MKKHYYFVNSLLENYERKDNGISNTLKIFYVKFY